MNRSIFALLTLTLGFIAANVTANTSITDVENAASPALKFQTKISWPKNKRAAIILTYDDALQSQLNIAVPQLNSAKLKGTFFLKAEGMTFKDMLLWRKASKAGHELGNHTLFHPCPNAMLPNREHYATERYTPQTMMNEIAVMNDLLFGIDGKEVRTMSYPCSQTTVGGIDYLETLRQSGLIQYARTGGDPYTSVVSDFGKLDLYSVPSNGPVNHPDGAELIAYVERVRAVEGLGVLQFHGVGGDYLEVSAEAHKELLDYLQKHPDVWVGTFQDVLTYITARSSVK